jgi:hypothetical protein
LLRKKKLVLILTVLVFALVSVVGCGGSDTNEPSDGAQSVKDKLGGRIIGIDPGAGIMAASEKAFNAYKEIQKTMWGYMKDRETLGFMGVYARRVLTATAQLWCGWLLMDQAIVVTKRLAELAEDHYEYPFYKGKMLSIRYYLNNVVPNVWHLEEIIKMADTSVLEATDDIFEY